MPNGPIFVAETGAFLLGGQATLGSCARPEGLNYAWAQLGQPNNGVGGALSAGETKAAAYEVAMERASTQIHGYTYP